MKPKITFIGLGNMGMGMATRLLNSNFDVTVYNRTIEKALSLKNLGAKVSSSVRDAIQSADIIITMVTDDKALKSLLFAQDGLKSMSKNSVHISMSTISENLALELTTNHEEQHIGFVAAPVFGRPLAAAAGQLFILAAGKKEVLEKCSAVFSVLGQKTIPLGDKPSVSVMIKILGNFMLFSAIETLAEAMSHAKKAGLSEVMFLESMTSTIFSSPFYKNYGQMMVDENYPTEKAVSFNIALKDVSLALETSIAHKTNLPTAKLIESHLKQGIELGYESLDVSALKKLNLTKENL